MSISSTIFKRESHNLDEFIVIIFEDLLVTKKKLFLLIRLKIKKNKLSSNQKNSLKDVTFIKNHEETPWNN